MVEQSYHVTDPAMLRALAHPLRQRIIWELSVRTGARAADLAEVMGEPANAVSYHLRALGKAGLIEEATELARDSRDRVWRMSHQEGIYAEPGELGADLLIEEQLGWVRDMLYERIPRDDSSIRGEYLGAVLLTKAEANQMFDEVVTVLERWRLHGAEQSFDDPAASDRVFHRTVFLAGRRATGESA